MVIGEKCTTARLTPGSVCRHYLPAGTRISARSDSRHQGRYDGGQLAFYTWFFLIVNIIDKARKAQ